jgi:hypothetical protein
VIAAVHRSDSCAASEVRFKVSLAGLRRRVREALLRTHLDRSA